MGNLKSRAGRAGGIALWALLLLATSSCVPNKNYVYLQEKAEEKSTTDSLLHNAPEPYVIRPLDILYINLKSIYPEAIEIMSQSIAQQGAAGGNINAGQQGGLFFYLQGYTVTDSGNLRMPLIGKVKAAGLPIPELEAKLQTEVEKYFNETQVEVKLPGTRINVLGEVRRPGQQQYFHNLVDIYEAIGRAGDCTEIADRRHVLILRRNGANDFERYELDLTDLETLEDDNFYLQHNDFVYVRPLRIREYGFRTSGFQNFQLILSSFASILSFISVILLIQDRSN